MISLQMIIDSARRNKCGGSCKDHTYSFYKKQIERLNLSADDYESAIKKLCDALEY